MRKKTLRLTIGFIFCFAGIAYSQGTDSSSTHWEMDVVVMHPGGLNDTVTFGADVNGAEGFQKGLDIMDRSFPLPVAIRGNDAQIEKDSGTCPANMRRDIRAFSQNILFSFFIKSDTFPNKDTLLRLFFDSSQFGYRNQRWEIGKIRIRAYGGFMEDIDGIKRCIYRNGKRGYYCDDYPGITILKNPFSFPILFEENPPEYYTGPCAENTKIIKFIVEVIFIDKSIGLPNRESLENKINILPGKFSVSPDLPAGIKFNYSILNLSGQEVSTGVAHPGEEINFPNLKGIPGIYILKVSTDNFLTTHKFFIN